MAGGPEIAEELSVTVHSPLNTKQQPQTDRTPCPIIEGVPEVINERATVDTTPQMYAGRQSQLQVSEEPFARVNTEDLQSEDIVIAVMGPTGSGKSTFVCLASGQGIHGDGHELTSCTKDIRAIRFLDQESGRHVVLVDTPGFDDTFKSDLDILTMISDWFNSSYKRGMLLSGIVYLHRITDNRMAGTPLKNLRLLQKLCGNDAMRKVYLTTTMWDEVDWSIGERRWEELKTEYWRSMIARGAQAVSRQVDKSSARRIIRLIVSQEATRKPVLLQVEMTDLQKELKETQAGKELYAQLEQFAERRIELLKRIDRERKVPLEARGYEELLGDYNALCVQIDDALRQMQELKPSWLKKLRRRFFVEYSEIARSPFQTDEGQQFQTDIELEMDEESPQGSGKQHAMADYPHPTSTEQQPRTCIARRQSLQEPPQAGSLRLKPIQGPQVCEKPAIVDTEDLEPGDIVIAVMGPTGSGKSTFVRTASGHDVKGIGHGLTSHTKGVLAIRFLDQESGRHVVLVDTPGFDDTFRSDLDILNMISDWLDSSYKKGKRLSGILYLHRITDNRMAGTPLKNIRMFQKLCGKDALDKVYLITTMWDEVDKSTGERRLEELKNEYWKSMTDQGAQLVQTDKDSVGRIIRLIVSQQATRTPVLLQKEMTELQKELKETESRKELYYQLERLFERQKILLQKISRGASDASVLEELQREYNDIGAQIDDKLRSMQELRLPRLESLLRSFSRKRE